MTSVRIITSKVLSGTRSELHDNPHPSVEEIIDAREVAGICWETRMGLFGLSVSLCVCPGIDDQLQRDRL
jgi:hypothetical protein